MCGVGHNEALDRTMSGMGKIFIDCVNGKAISDIDGQSDRDDVANRVFLREIDVSAVPLLKTSYPQLESNFKRSDVQFGVKECALRCSRSSTAEGNAHLQIFLVFFLVWSD